MKSVHTFTNTKDEELEEFNEKMARLRQLTSYQPVNSAQQPTSYGLSNASPNANVGNNPFTGGNIDLTPYEDNIAEGWQIEPSEYQINENLISSLEISNFNHSTGEEETQLTVEKEEGDMFGLGSSVEKVKKAGADISNKQMIVGGGTAAGVWRLFFWKLPSRFG